MDATPLLAPPSRSPRNALGLRSLALGAGTLALLFIGTSYLQTPAQSNEGFFLESALAARANAAARALRCPQKAMMRPDRRSSVLSSLRAKSQTVGTVKEPEIRIDTPLKIEAVLFDLDGTLLDFEGGSHDALNKVLEPFNSTGKAQLTWEMHGTIVGRRASEWSSEILEQCGISPDQLAPEKYVEKYLEKMPEYYPTMPLMPGALNLVKNLKAAGFKVAVASSSERLSIEKKLKFHPVLLELMDIVQPGDDPEIKAGKPAPDIFLAAAKKLGVKPENCLVFEDSPFGLQGAKAGNMACVAIPDARMPIADPARFGAADFLLNSMEEFKMDYIEKM